jgi:sirohydrochlorin cobaltochelatase
VARGVREIVIVPIFLGQGGHLLRDLPLLVEGLRATYPDRRVLDRAGSGGRSGRAGSDGCVLRCCWIA